MNVQRKTTIQVRRETHMRLDEMASRKDTLDDVIVRILDENKKLKAICEAKDKEIKELRKKHCDCAIHAESIA